MNRKKVVAAMIVWICIGFNSWSGVQNLLDFKVSKNVSASAKILAMPIPSAQATPQAAYEVYVTLPWGTIIDDPEAVSCAP